MRRATLALALVLGVGCGGGEPPPRTPDQMRASLSPYELDLTEVTVAAYEACVKEGGCTTDGLNKSAGGSNDDHCNWGQSSRAEHPINCVDWNQAEAYCKWAGKRLPTEQEWEYAASSGKGWTYPWGNEEPASSKLCWSRSDGTCKVGSFPAGDNAFGVKALAGNVWEWTSSNYDANARVVRGGGWDNKIPDFVRASFRLRDAPSNRYSSLGFRCARSLP